MGGRGAGLGRVFYVWPETACFPWGEGGQGWVGYFTFGLNCHKKMFPTGGSGRAGVGDHVRAKRQNIF